MPAEPFSRDELIAAPSGFFHDLRVRFQDVDAAGIVFFARILDYCHDGYVAFLSAAGCPLHVSLQQKAWIAPLVHAEADFIRPLRFGELLRIHLVAARLRGSVYTLGYRLERAPDAAAAPGAAAPGEVVAVGQTVHIVVEPQGFTRVPLPEAMRTALERLQPS